MIVEMRTYSYQPGTVARALETIALGVEERTRLSPLGGLWQTESGRLHQIIHLWPFADLAEREHVRGRFGELRNWPARTGAYMESSETKILIPAPFSPPLTARVAGPVYEIRTDTYAPGQLKAILEIWGAALETPPPSFIGAWHTELGPMNQWIHIWAFATLDARAAHHARMGVLASQSGKHELASLFVKQESALCRPASFSPLQ